MQSEVPLASGSEPPKGLPPVVPPSGKFIAQLFLVPGIIVALAVLLLLGFSWLAGGASDPARLLANLKSSNPDVRWRAAHDLAQVLLRDQELAANPSFGLDVAEQMRLALQEEKDQPAQRTSDDSLAKKRELDSRRSYIQYLCASLGNMAIPVGAPLLGEVATQEDTDELAVFRQRQAVWALANLGANVRRFDQLPSAQQHLALAGLEHESDRPTERGKWAKSCLDYLRSGPPRSLRLLGLDATLLQCAKSNDPFVREVTCLALSFWTGTPEENAVLDAMLVRLSYDDGHGETSLPKSEEETGAEPFTKIPGLKIRYNAAVALARRGSDKVRLDLLAEMLDESAQQQNFRLRRQNGQELPDEATARTAILSTLQAIIELHRKRPDKDLAEVLPAIQKLAQGSTLIVRTEADRALLALSKK